MLKRALKAGSSQQGNTNRAPVGLKRVAAIYLQNENKVLENIDRSEQKMSEKMQQLVVIFLYALLSEMIVCNIFCPIRFKMNNLTNFK